MIHHRHTPSCHHLLIIRQWQLPHNPPLPTEPYPHTGNPHTTKPPPTSPSEPPGEVPRLPSAPRAPSTPRSQFHPTPPSSQSRRQPLRLPLSPLLHVHPNPRFLLPPSSPSPLPRSPPRLRGPGRGSWRDKGGRECGPRRRGKQEQERERGRESVPRR